VLPSGDGKWRDPPQAFQVGRSAIPRGPSTTVLLITKIFEGLY